tara:strand:- start:1016 stop:1174 length:159 start_codon:yes stop_codon:yes gene_type:complete
MSQIFNNRDDSQAGFVHIIVLLYPSVVIDTVLGDDVPGCPPPHHNTPEEGKY